jgi:hypothetical protein
MPRGQRLPRTRSGDAQERPGGSDNGSVARKRRRWPRLLAAFATLVIVGAIVVTHYLQPAQLTALILARASGSLHLELHTTGSGSYALRPEPRLVLPGLSASVPGGSAPFFRSKQVELALPWDTLRGRGTDISSVVLKSPDIDLPGLKSWLATRPPRIGPFKFPTLTRGLRIDDGLLRGSAWRIEHLDARLPSLVDGKLASLDASGDFVRAARVSKFALAANGTPAGAGNGLRIDHAHLALKSDGDLPSLDANGSMIANDNFALDVRGTMQRMPTAWAESIDSSFARPGDTPFSIVVGDGASIPSAGSAAATASAQPGLRMQFALGDARRQPALVISGAENSGETLVATLHGQLSRWPDAWPGFSPAMESKAAPIVFDASYQGSIFLDAPIAFDIRRADAVLQGRLSIAELRTWIRRKFDTFLPPMEATLRAPQIEVGGMQLRGVQMDIHEDVAPSQPAATPTVVAPKS